MICSPTGKAVWIAVCDIACSTSIPVATCSANCSIDWLTAPVFPAAYCSAICVIDWATGLVGFSATWLAIWDKIWFTSLPAPLACADCEANCSIFWVIWPASAPGFAVAIWVAICSIVWVIDASAVGKVLDVPSGGVVVTFDEYTCARKKLR